MTLLENEHIRLRALEPEDLSLLYNWENDSSLWTVGATVAPYSRYALKEYIVEARRDIYELKQLRLVIELKETRDAIGLIDLFDFDPHNRRAATGILVDSRFQKNGWAAEALTLLLEYAFSFLRLRQLYAYVPADNESSRRLYQRCGFIVSGTLTDWIVSGNTYKDVVVMQKFNDA